ncbi:flagella basal body P-ring formation protein FlgA [Bifidobacterium sp. 64T4]|uniref:SAF domain-containing protein n=1 Tax=Bifidobacterium pongonis TaxID=2834432 RepID=UPI001C566E96|nr:SAF domain-containing protein [Bifidobacterium pongonis]MBW3094675.1 flagella basal body P-ring formation protein FlgA [Bifidobacterium pongonis]
MKNVNAPPWSPLTAPTLGARRRRAKLARIATILCICMAVFGFLHALDAITGTDTVVTAVSSIARGTTIRQGDVALTRVPASPIVNGALHSAAEAEGSIAQSHIEAGQLLYGSSVAKAPTVMPGHTVLEIAVANNVEALIPGDTVSLVSSSGCEPASGTDAGSAEPAACTLAERATVMEVGRNDDEQIGRERGRETLSLIVEPDIAMRVMTAAETGVIVAVHE